MAKKATATKAAKKPVKKAARAAIFVSASIRGPNGWRYVNKIPKKIPEGKILCHNHVQPAHPINMNGFRVWLVDSSDKWERCLCGWGDGIEHYKGKKESR